MQRWLWIAGLCFWSGCSGTVETFATSSGTGGATGSSAGGTGGTSGSGGETIATVPCLDTWTTKGPELTLTPKSDPGSSWATLRSIAVAPDGDVVVAGDGVVDGTSPLEWLLGGVTLTLPGAEANTFPLSAATMFVARFHEDGSLVWLKTMPASGDVVFAGRVALDAGGNTLFLATFADTVTIDGLAVTSAASQVDSFLAKLDPSGNLVWVRQLGATGEFQVVSSGDLVIGPDGSMLLSVAAEGSLSLGPDTVTDPLVLALAPDGTTFGAAGTELAGFVTFVSLARTEQGVRGFTDYFNTLFIGNVTLPDDGDDVENLAVFDLSKEGAVSNANPVPLAPLPAQNAEFASPIAITAHFAVAELASPDIDYLGAFAARLDPQGGIEWTQPLAQHAQAATETPDGHLLVLGPAISGCGAGAPVLTSYAPSGEPEWTLKLPSDPGYDPPRLDASQPGVVVMAGKGALRRILLP